MSSASHLSALRAAIAGEVLTDEVSRGLYSTDASMYRITPAAVVLPRSVEDLRATLDWAHHHGVAVIPRGGGTSLGGQVVGSGVVVDVSKYVNRLLELNPAEGWARVEPGLVRDELNVAAAAHGLHYAIDPATANRANIGGMIGNNASGTRSLRYGKTVDRLLEVRVRLLDGTELTLGELSPAEYAAKAAQPDREGALYAGARAIIDELREEISARYPTTSRRCNGYLLDEFVHTDRWNLAKLICGSEGTLATILEARVRLDPLPGATALVVVHFAELTESIRSVAPILEHDPAAVELLDRALLGFARGNLATRPKCGFLVGEPAAVLVVEVDGADAVTVAERGHRLADALRREGIGYAWPVLVEPAAQADVWTVRRAGLGLMLGVKGEAKPQAFIEDAALPIPALPDYIDKVLDACRRRNVPVAMYAHASVGLLHVRPFLNPKSADDLAKMWAIADEALGWVIEAGGSWSGEHGDGIVRSGDLERFFGPRLVEGFRRLKALFDPAGLMNPGKIVDPLPRDANYRYGPDYPATAIDTIYRFRADGGLPAAVELCNGVGACRKTLGGTMCPSYMATRDEEHSTRGRANALRLALTGQLPGGLTSRRLYEVFDLCLACKGCQAECPSNVDVARLKMEFLRLYHDAHGLTLRDRLVGASPLLARRLAGPLAPLANALGRSAPARWFLQRAAGLDARRTPPAYARRPFAAWWRRHVSPPAPRQVVLFDDTYLNFHEPAVGISAVELLESCGYQVLVAGAGCCQRPRLSHGLLREARRDGEQTLRRLDEYLRRGLEVVVCEPGCASALTDDLLDLIDDDELAERIRAGVLMIDVFLAREQAAGRLSGQFSSPHAEVLIHGHCHQKALWGTGGMKAIYAGIPGLIAREVDSGCCGMAGSFGYETEHYELSRKIAGDRLLPAVAAAPESAVVACGFSCRHQLADFGQRAARHFVETIRFTPDSGTNRSGD